MPSGEEAGLNLRAAPWLALLTVVFLAQALAFHGVRFDDAYITFRYAQNLASGAGMVFNPGDRIMGSTSPGETLLSALGYLYAGRDDLPGLMAVVGCVGWTAQSAALFLLLRRALGPFRAGLVAAGIAVGGAGSAQWVALETNVAAAAALFAIYLGYEKRWLGAAALSAFAGLMRPDAHLVLVPLSLLALRDLRSSAWKPAAVLLPLASLWPAFAALYFGSLIPQSAVAKYHQTTPAAYALHIVRDLPNEVVRGHAPVALVVVFWALAVIGAVLVVRRDARLAVLPAYPVLLACAYVVLAPEPAHRWHIYPITLLSVSFALVTVGTGLERVPRPWREVAGGAVAALCGVATVHFATTFKGEFKYGVRERFYKEVAAYLAAHAAPGDWADSDEVGTIAYYADISMYDNPGLVTRDPNAAFAKLQNGEPTNLRWLVVNGGDLDSGGWFLRPLLERGPTVEFRDDPYVLWLVDVKGSRATPSP